MVIWCFLIYNVCNMKINQIVYVLLFQLILFRAIGCPPWQMADERSNKLFQTIVIEKNIDFVLKTWNRFNYIDDSMRDLLQKIFILNEKDRITTNDIIKHPWLC